MTQSSLSQVFRPFNIISYCFCFWIDYVPLGTSSLSHFNVCYIHTPFSLLRFTYCFYSVIVTQNQITYSVSCFVKSTADRYHFYDFS